jgi:hypothetical protein
MKNLGKLGKSALVLAALALALLVSGCASRVAGSPVAGAAAEDAALPEPTPESTTTTTATTTPPQPVVNERGFSPKKIGEKACYGPLEGDVCKLGVTFWIDKIAVDPPCDEFGERNAHTVVISMRVVTGTDSPSIQDAPLVFNPYSFIVIGKNGVSQKADFGICTDTTNVPETYGPNQKYAFKLELDVPVPHGALALQPGTVGEDGSGGWEWAY